MASATDFLEHLDPPAVWRHFATLCRIPRPSKHEAALRSHLQAWATAQGLAHETDAAGNLLIRKPASNDGLDLPATAFQAHLDMVCQQRTGHVHDWHRDPVTPTLRDGWVTAENTTLGADNGLGVALMLALLEDRSLRHGPIEALFTVDEEAGMGGARGLAPGWLKSRRMLNLDTEAWGEFYIGCAGGVDVTASRTCRPAPLPDGHHVLTITLGGLRGGHSGVDIHEGRGNAIKWLTALLCELGQTFPLRLASLNGGNARNALPRDATATLAVPDAAEFTAVLTRRAKAWRDAYDDTEPGFDIRVAEGSATAVMAPDDQAQCLATLHAAPHGVWRMSERLPGVVETSNNLGMADFGPSGGQCHFMVRSLTEFGADALAGQIESLLSLGGFAGQRSGHYPGWQPNPDSALLRHCRAVFERVAGHASEIKVIHAGLECGLIGALYPGMDIVSLGPTIRGAHAPGEAAEVHSVGQVWRLIQAILATPS